MDYDYDYAYFHEMYYEEIREEAMNKLAKEQKKINTKAA